MRQHLSLRMHELFDDDLAAGLALGYLVGDKRDIDDGFLTNLRSVGLSHIIVASGFHLGVILAFSRKIFGRLSRFAAFAGSIILLIAYILIVGASASLLRAGVMGMFSAICQYYGRKMHPLRAIIYAAALTLAYNPRFTINVAWYLSFVSYFGIVVFAPILKQYLYGGSKPSFLAGSVTITISAQIFCLPITIYCFGTVSILGVLANLIISPTIAAAMLLSLLSLPFPALVIFAKIVLRFHIFVVNQLAEWSWGIYEFSPGDASIFLLYVPICMVLICLAKREAFRFRSPPALVKYPKNGKIYSC